MALRVIRDVAAINAALINDASRKWTEAKNRFAIDEKNSFIIASAVADQVLGMFICLMSENKTEGNEFINSQVHMNCVLPDGRILDDNVRVESEMNLLPEFGYKRPFREVLPYIVKDSIEYREFLPNGDKTKSSRLFWKWDTAKLADANCPLKLQDVTAERARLMAEDMERRGEDTSDNFFAVEVDDEIRAMFA